MRFVGLPLVADALCRHEDSVYLRRSQIFDSCRRTAFGKLVQGEEHAEIVCINIDKLAISKLGPQWRGISRLDSNSNKVRATLQGLIGNRVKEDSKFPFVLEDWKFLVDEFEWVILGEGLKSEEQYQRVERYGRGGRRLGSAQRKGVWTIWNMFLSELRATRSCLPAQQVGFALENAEPEFDYVFIDEAQDLKPAAIRFCLGLAKDPKNVFLTADVNQTIYGSGIAWKKISMLWIFVGVRKFFVETIGRVKRFGKLLALLQSLSKA